MALQLQFSIEGEVQLSRELQLAIDKISNVQPFHKEAIDIMAERSDDIFKNKGSDIANGPKWAPLSKTTENLRASKVGHYKKPSNQPGLMRWTGNLQENTTKKSTSLQGLFSHNAEYASKLHKGEPSSNLPSRRIQDFDESTKDKMVKALQKKTQKDLGNFGKQI